MIRKLFFVWTFLVAFVFARVDIIAPHQFDIVSNRVIDVVFQSSVNHCFIMVNDELVSIKNGETRHSVVLDYGLNLISMHVFDQNMHLKHAYSRQLMVFRSLVFDEDLTKYEQVFLTELYVNDHIELMETVDSLGYQLPIKKRDLYAILIKLIGPDLTASFESRSLDYNDLSLYSHYLRLYQTNIAVLPEPYLKRFYPDGYVTREDFVNILMAIQGLDEQLSTSLIVHESLKIPNALTAVLPNYWQGGLPLSVVTKQEAMSILLALYPLEHPIFSPSEMVALYFPDIATDNDHYGLPFTKYLTTMTALLGSHFDQTKQYARQAWDTARKKWQSQNVFSNVNSFFANKPLDTHRDQPVDNQLPKVSVIDTEVIQDQTLQDNILDQYYVIQAGDSLPKIARQFYGSGDYWLDLASYNQLPIQEAVIDDAVQYSVHIVVGQQLMIPVLR